MSNQPKPIIATWLNLMYAFQALHGGQPRYVDTLHDVWKRGAPTPNSRLLDVKNYDPRKVQPGNYEARIVLPGLLAQWITDVANERGIVVNKDDVLRTLKRG